MWDIFTKHHYKYNAKLFFFAICMWKLFWRIILRWQYHNVHCDFRKVTVKFNRRRINGEPFGGQLIKAPCFTRATVRLLCGMSESESLRNRLAKAVTCIYQKSTSINYLGYWWKHKRYRPTEKKLQKKCRYPFGTGISYRFTVRLTYTVVKHKKKGRSGYMKSHKFFAWATVFCFVMTMITGYKRQ